MFRGDISYGIFRDAAKQSANVGWQWLVVVGKTWADKASWARALYKDVNNSYLIYQLFWLLKQRPSRVVADIRWVWRLKAFVFLFVSLPASTILDPIVCVFPMKHLSVYDEVFSPLRVRTKPGGLYWSANYKPPYTEVMSHSLKIDPWSLHTLPRELGSGCDFLRWCVREGPGGCCWNISC
jgi:hypothetical protein